MTPTRRAGGMAVLVIALLGLAYTGAQIYRRSQPEECHACNRPIHAHSRTVALVGGRPKPFCCPACALTERRQEGRPLPVTELTAYLNGSTLAPDHAYVVQGSDVNMCAHTQELIVAEKRAADLHYDRCAPSLLAFAERSEAVRFAREHGGTVLLFTEAAASLGK